MTDASGSETFYYDTMGRQTRSDKVVDGNTYTTQSTYDGLGRITSLTYPDNTVATHTYNGPELATVNNGSTTYASYSGFNELGLRGTATFGNGVSTTYTYFSNNFRLKTLNTVNRESASLQNLGYTFDREGNVTAITDSVSGNQIFGYDALNRITSASGPYCLASAECVPFEPKS